MSVWPLLNLETQFRSITRTDELTRARQLPRAWREQIGAQELDEQCRTMRFVLSFDFRNVTEAESRWDRLAVYAESYGSYLDRYELDR